MKTVSIYALIDPLTKEVRYIGKSVNPNTRFRAHLRNRSDTHCARWLGVLRDLGLEPEMTILEAETEGDGSEAEIRWIAYGRELGWPLTNLTDGGDGSLGVVQSEETRQKRAEAMKAAHARGLFPPPVNKGGTISEEQKAQISAKLMGHPVAEKSVEALKKHRKDWTGVPNPHSSETRQKMSDAHKGKKRGPMSEETKAKISAKRKGQSLPSPSAETRAKLSAANSGKALSEEHKEKIGAANRGRVFSEEHKQHLAEAHRKPKGDEAASE